MPAKSDHIMTIEQLAPFRRESRQAHPEDPVPLANPRRPHRALEGNDLMTKSQDFRGERCALENARAEQDADNMHDAHVILSVRGL